MLVIADGENQKLVGWSLGGAADARPRPRADAGAPAVHYVLLHRGGGDDAEWDASAAAVAADRDRDRDGARGGGGGGAPDGAAGDDGRDAARATTWRIALEFAGGRGGRREPVEIAVSGHHLALGATRELRALDAALPGWARGAEWTKHSSELARWTIEPPSAAAT